ncbi:MAG: hypothetical protein WD468_04180, partial [Pirellulales bacterium]
DVFAVQDPAEVGDLIEFAAILFFEGLGSVAQHALIAIAQCDEMVLERIDMAFAAAVETDGRHADLTVNVGTSDAWQHRTGSGNTGSLHQERPTSLFRHGKPPT